MKLWTAALAALACTTPAQAQSLSCTDFNSIVAAAPEGFEAIKREQRSSRQFYPTVDLFDPGECRVHAGSWPMYVCNRSAREGRDEALKTRDEWLLLAKACLPGWAIREGAMSVRPSNSGAPEFNMLYSATLEPNDDRDVRVSLRLLETNPPANARVAGPPTYYLSLEIQKVVLPPPPTRRLVLPPPEPRATPDPRTQPSPRDSL